jgi:hypothetical protein
MVNFRTFCEDADLQTIPLASRPDWPTSHSYTFLDSIGISGDNEMLTWLSTHQIYIYQQQLPQICKGLQAHISINGTVSRCFFYKITVSWFCLPQSLIIDLLSFLNFWKSTKIFEIFYLSLVSMTAMNDAVWLDCFLDDEFLIGINDIDEACLKQCQEHNGACRNGADDNSELSITGVIDTSH